MGDSTQMVIEWFISACSWSWISVSAMSIAIRGVFFLDHEVGCGHSLCCIA
jgi:ABC-type phosphate transport system auxiliary subunit